ncbi:YdjY domain-containing protein [Planctomycetota bacterium]
MTKVFKLNCLILLAVVILISARLTLVRAEDQQPPKTTNNKKSGEKKGDNIITSMRGLNINMTKKEFSTPGLIRQRQGPIELIACSPGSDKVHEVIVQVNCSPIDFHFAMTFIGFEHGKPAHLGEDGQMMLPVGPRAVIFLEWEDLSGQTKRYRFEDLILNIRTGKPMRRNGWTFTGSSFERNPHSGKKVFLANEVKTLIATYHDRTAVLDNPSITGRDDSFFEGNPLLLPEMGSKIRMIVKHPSPADLEMWEKWEQAGDDESYLLAPQTENGLPVEIIRRWEGTTSDYDDAYFTVIRSKKKLEETWQRMHCKQQKVPALPEIDFDNHMLVALFCGIQPTSGYKTTCPEVLSLSDAYIVYFEDVMPGADDKVEAGEISPWELIQLPFSDVTVQFRPVAKIEPDKHTIIDSWTGENSNMPAETKIIKNKNTWTELWKKVFENLTSQPPAPDINFSQHMVLCVFAGPQQQPGVEVSITNLVKSDENLVVEYRQTSPSGEQGRMPYGPFHVLVTQKTDKPILFKKVE